MKKKKNKIKESEANKISFWVSAYAGFESEANIQLVNPENVLDGLRKCPGQEWKKKTEFVWELKWGFMMAAVSRAARLRGCPLSDELPMCI